MTKTLKGSVKEFGYIIKGKGSCYYFTHTTVVWIYSDSVEIGQGIM